MDEELEKVDEIDNGNSARDSINMDAMSDEELKAKLQKGHAVIEIKGIASRKERKKKATQEKNETLFSP